MWDLLLLFDLAQTLVMAEPLSFESKYTVPNPAVIVNEKVKSKYLLDPLQARSSCHVSVLEK